VAWTPQQVAHPRFLSEALADAAALGDRLAIGLRRSYGDTCRFERGRLLDMSGLDRFIAFDPATGIVRAEAGLSLDALLRFCVPRGWFVPVTPGTRYVTLGGALANDVHGKNHHRMGTFGRHVRRFSLLRSDRGRVEVTPRSEPDLFAATLGGLGLTGIVLDLDLQLTPIASSNLDVEAVPLGGLSDYFALDRDSGGRFEHTVAWIDCTRTGARAGTGVYSRANWSASGPLEPHPTRQITLPAFTPGAPFTGLTVGAFNRFYRALQLIPPRRKPVPYAKVFHPLDAIGGWNRLYGRAGFYQHQSVVPPEAAEGALKAMLNAVAASGEGSALVVLKSFGELASPGWMSFPRPGHTLAIDFQNRGPSTLALMARLDDVVREAGGALYPAKDGRMSRRMLDLGYARFPDLLALRDPACGSDFLDRMETP
jgi:L-gulonolactone oxidase